MSGKGDYYVSQQQPSRVTIISLSELRAIIAANTQAIETSTYRVKEHLQLGLPMNLHLIREQFETIQRIVTVVLKQIQEQKE